MSRAPARAAVDAPTRASPEAPDVPPQAGRSVPADLPPSAVHLVPMLAAHVDEVLALERRAYDFPWSRGNFVDSIAAGHLAQRLLDDRGRLLGYFVAMCGAGEMHLLNLSVAPEEQGRGRARTMLDALIAECRAAGVRPLWLEVRAGNRRARSLYGRYGFAEVGVRRGYYPAAAADAPSAPGAVREDAVVMTLDVGTAPP